MQVALNLGTININDQEVARFIQNKNIDEIKALFVNFLKNQITTHQASDSLDSQLKNLEPLKNINIELEKDFYKEYIESKNKS